MTETVRHDCQGTIRVLHMDSTPDNAQDVSFVSNQKSLRRIRPLKTKQRTPKTLVYRKETVGKYQISSTYETFVSTRDPLQLPFFRKSLNPRL